MVLAAALISLAVAAPQAPAQAVPPAASQAAPQAERQSAEDDSRPYSVQGARRAMAAGNQPSIDYNSQKPTPRGYRLAIDSRAVNPDPCSLFVMACQPVWRGGANPTWHDQFLAMTGPTDYTVPYSGMSNSQVLQAVASSIVINLAIQAVVSLIHDQVVQLRADAKQKKIERVRGEIRAELEELDRVNAAARAAGQGAVK